MGRRARNESRFRSSERRRSRRARRRELVDRLRRRFEWHYDVEKAMFYVRDLEKKQRKYPPSLIDSIRREIRRTFITRHMREVETVSWREWLRRELYRLTFRSVWTRFVDHMLEDAEKARLIWDLVRGRVKTVFSVEYKYMDTESLRVYVVDELLRSLPPEGIYDVCSILYNMARRRGVTLREYLNPFFRYWLANYMLMFREPPCTHGSFAFKLTPVTLRMFGGRVMSYYVMRWGRARDIHADPYLGITRAVSFNFWIYREKRDMEWFNALMYAGFGGMFPDRLVVHERDHTYTVTREMKLLSEMVFMHRMKQSFAKMSGQREVWVNIRPCSIYVSPHRPPRHWLILESGFGVLVAGYRRHRKLRTMDYVYGLRGI
ncbi:MAG: hypothetical protein QW734_04660 [Candidatus Bathyarchaeia archaeon]